MESLVSSSFCGSQNLEKRIELLMCVELFSMSVGEATRKDVTQMDMLSTSAS